jgi:hypothetical protein
VSVQDGQAEEEAGLWGHQGLGGGVGQVLSVQMGRPNIRPECNRREGVWVG